MVLAPHDGFDVPVHGIVNVRRPPRRLEEDEDEMDNAVAGTDQDGALVGRGLVGGRRRWPRQ